MKSSYIFLMGPPRSGSTALYHIFKACGARTMSQDEGQKFWMNPKLGPVDITDGMSSRNPAYYADNSNYNWSEIKRIWENEWGGDGVKFEKSPPNIFRYELLKKEFPGAKFIGIIRNPYDQIQTWMRLYGAPDKKSSYEAFTYDWLVYAQKLMLIANEPDVIWFKYEDLVYNKLYCALELSEWTGLDLDLSDFKNKNRNLYTHSLEYITNKLLYRRNHWKDSIDREPVLKFFKYPLYTFNKTPYIYKSIEEYEQQRFIEWPINEWTIKFGLVKKRFKYIYEDKTYCSS